MRRTGDGVHQSPYATVAYPDMQRWHKDMQRWHKATDTPSQNYWVASFELPAVPSSTSRRNRRKHPPQCQTGAGCHWFETHLSNHLLSAGAQTDASPHDPGMQFCDGVSVAPLLLPPFSVAQDLCAGALGVSGCFSVALNATVAISRVSDCGYAIVAHKATTPSHNTGYFGVYRVGICRIFRGILSGITCTGR